MIEAAFHLDLNVEFFGEFARNVEAEPGATGFARAVILTAPKSLKNMLLI